jgi:hypothetical protein
MSYLVYKTGSGEIDRLVVCPEELIQMQLRQGESYVAGNADVLAHYISDGVIAQKPAMPVVQDGMTLTVPPGTEYRVTLEGADEPLAEGVSDTGAMELELVPGHTYTVRLAQFPYLDAEVVLST